MNEISEVKTQKIVDKIKEYIEAYNIKCADDVFDVDCMNQSQLGLVYNIMKIIFNEQ